MSGTSASSLLHQISQRLSLRPPQRLSLERLAAAAGAISLDKRKPTDLTTALAAIRAVCPDVATLTDFERDFPNLCFALATGVGKTRCMGAFIAYLSAVHGVANFMVLAPNLTIYNKLIRDLHDTGSSKYVFRGLSQFANNPPKIVTGETYESGAGVSGNQIFDRVTINIFNIAKINMGANEKLEDGTPRKAKLRRLAECIGQSYFDHLASCPDLVLIMDEAHRYRASASFTAIQDLKPVLGLELTATPREVGSGQPFRNVLVEYPLSQAMKDGFVKEPAVATRQDFDRSIFVDADGDEVSELERVKLLDGVTLHEETKTQLILFAHQKARPLVKPFMLVVAANIAHAENIASYLRSDQFQGGRYRDAILTVHSKKKSGDDDETVDQLLQLEEPDNQIEVVIHVDKLKEGWDVTNLYTLVPLRAANSPILVEQSIGRGLRLPYGQRTGVAAVDQLTVVSHDRFDDIIRHANSQGSIFQKRLLSSDGSLERHEVVVSTPVLRTVLGLSGSSANSSSNTILKTDAERAYAESVLAGLSELNGIASANDLLTPDVERRASEAAAHHYDAGSQDRIAEVLPEVERSAVVATVLRNAAERIIIIPRVNIINITQKTGYRTFNLDMTDIPTQVPDEHIMTQSLETGTRVIHGVGQKTVSEPRPENRLVTALMDFNDVDYHAHDVLINRLAGEVVAYLRTKVTDEAKVEAILQHHRSVIAELIRMQLSRNFQVEERRYEVDVRGECRIHSESTFEGIAGDVIRSVRDEVADPIAIRSMIFGSFRRCVVDRQKFDTDTERKFALLCEDDSTVVKWLKPTAKNLTIPWHRDHEHRPDFIVETKTANYLCETKRRIDLDDQDVKDKAVAGAVWCHHASKYSTANRGNPWSYLLIPHDAVTGAATMPGLAAKFTFTAPASALS